MVERCELSCGVVEGVSYLTVCVCNDVVEIVCDRKRVIYFAVWLKGVRYFVVWLKGVSYLAVWV